jgi:acyl-CoA thioester hydrolase
LDCFKPEAQAKVEPEAQAKEKGNRVQNLLDGFPVIIEQPVAWGEQDCFAHVNNVVYFRYFENARVAYLEKLDWQAYLKATGIGPIVATAQARFRRAVTFPDSLMVGARISAMGEDRYTMDYRIVSKKLADVTTSGDTVVVTFNYRENKKVPIPAEMRSLIERMEGKRFS